MDLLLKKRRISDFSGWSCKTSKMRVRWMLSSKLPSEEPVDLGAEFRLEDLIIKSVKVDLLDCVCNLSFNSAFSFSNWSMSFCMASNVSSNSLKITSSTPKLTFSIIYLSFFFRSSESESNCCWSNPTFSLYSFELFVIFFSKTATKKKMKNLYKIKQEPTWA